MTDLTFDQARRVDRIGQKEAKDFVGSISTNQIRRVYDEVKKAEYRYRADEDLDAALRRLQLLKPKLAYLVARNEDATEFQTKVTTLIDKAVESGSRGKLVMFFHIMEAYVSYHNYFSQYSAEKLQTTPKSIETNSVTSLAEECAQSYFEDDITTSQLRHIYGDIKRAEIKSRNVVNEHADDEKKKRERGFEEARTDLVLLCPNLTYIASRHDEMTGLVSDVRGWIEYVITEDKDALEDFFDLMEAVVAYHSYYQKTDGDH